MAQPRVYKAPRRLVEAVPSASNPSTWEVKDDKGREWSVKQMVDRVVDTIARAFAHKLSEAWKQPVIISNRPGAVRPGTLGQVVPEPVQNGYAITGVCGGLTTFSTVMVEAFNIMQDRITRARLAGDPPDVLISPRVGRSGQSVPTPLRYSRNTSTPRSLRSSPPVPAPSASIRSSRATTQLSFPHPIPRPRARRPIGSRHGPTCGGIASAARPRSAFYPAFRPP